MAARKSKLPGADRLTPVEGKSIYYDKNDDKFYELTTEGKDDNIVFVEITNKSLINKAIAANSDYFTSNTTDKGLGGTPNYIQPLETPNSDTTVRYPKDVPFDQDTDYVLFQFGKFIPPFSQRAEDGNTGAINQYQSYNASATDIDIEALQIKKVGEAEAVNVRSLMLPMPQDLSNELKNDWQGKSFTRLGKTAISAMAGGAASNAIKTITDVGGNINAFREAITGNVINNIPGVGGNITFNDISGSTRGVVLNPNAEVLYDSPNLREIGMVFKMVPKNSDDAKNIKMICDAFRIASSPIYGGEGQLTQVGSQASSLAQDNFIRVPFLCKFVFMKGGNPHPWLAQFKPCAITRVQVNYTPDGTYATYDGGSPIATELSINFLESKLIYQTEINDGF